MTENEIKEPVMESPQNHFDTGEEEIRAENEKPENTNMDETSKAGESNTESNLLGEIEDLKDRYLRLNAEFDNYKKRNLKERIEFSKVANSEIMEALLPVLDDFERAVKALEQAKDNKAKEGISLIQHKLKNILEQKGLQAINSIGKDFDVEMHEAITTIPVESEKQKGKVVDEVERGYLLNGKILRHAKVVVGG